MEKNLITKKQLISSIIFNGGNSILFLFFLKALYYDHRILLFLTYLSYCANSFYLFFCFLCDIFLYLKEKNSEINDLNYKLIESEENKNDNKTWFEKLNNWNRKKYGIICNTFSFFVTISFWSLYFMGESFIKVSSGFYPMLRTYYLHLIITIIIIIDIYNSKRNVTYSSCDINMIFNLFLIYCIIIAINKYFFNTNIYAFMHFGWIILMIFIIIFFFILYFCYRLNLWLINYVNNEN